VPPLQLENGGKRNLVQRYHHSHFYHVYLIYIRELTPKSVYEIISKPSEGEMDTLGRHEKLLV